MKANRLFVLAAVSFVAVVSGGSAAEADPLNTALAQKVLCTQVAGPTVLTPTDISKTAASVRSPMTTPPRAFFYGARACGQLGFAVDVHVTSAVKLPAGITHFDVGATAGGRNGKWEPNHQFLSVDELVTNECAGKQGQALTDCNNTQMQNKCSHLARSITASWKKSGWPAFKTYRSATGGFWFDRNTMTCQTSSKVSWVPQAEYVPNSTVAGGKTQGDLDGFMKVPAAGQEDVYRFATEVVLLKDAIVQLPADDATADAAGGWSAFIAPSAINGQNPPLLQLPVEVYVKPGYN